MTLKPPWWWCCAWWSPWCVIDTALHELHIPIWWVCDRHDAMVDRRAEKYGCAPECPICHAKEKPDE